MRIGDLLEWLAAACLVAAPFPHSIRVTIGLVLAAAFLMYQGQCWATHPVPRLSWKSREDPEDEA